MRRTARTVVGGAVGITAALAAAYGLIVRPWHLRWGATRDEVAKPLPFDSVVPHPNYFTTRAITIDAPPERVWPWLVQMGELPRAGFYSYAWIEQLMGMKIENADRILPDYQDLKPGDRLDRAGNMLVRAVKPPTLLVLEDLHWAYQTSVDLAEHLMPLTERVPLEIVGLFRRDQ